MARFQGNVTLKKKYSKHVTAFEKRVGIFKSDNKFNSIKANQKY